MNEDYDFIILGTGLKECILSGLLSVDKKTVLHMDRNNYYGADSASLNLEQLWKKFLPDQKMPDSFGRSRDYNIDLCPKLVMACGYLVKMLLHTQVTRYLEFRTIGGSYVWSGGSLQKVPATAAEALASGLMGFFQKRKFKSFLEYVQNYEQKDAKTWPANGVQFDASRNTARELFNNFGLDEATIEFTGHAIALHLDDSYLDRPALETIERCNLYAYSVARYGSSPYIYPIYGLGGLPEGFSRLAAVYGGVYMLNKPISDILYNDDGTVRGVKSEGEEARCKKLIADPSYFLGTNKVRKTGQVARSICILNHPVDGTKGADSAQIIIPNKQIPGRKSDIYMCVVGSQHMVAPQGKFIAVAQCNVETTNPHNELIPALRLLGQIEKEFFWVSDQYEATEDGKKDNIFITSSYDATSHFGTTSMEVMAIYERVTGQPVNLEKKPEELQNQ